jgi:hypothetical protein
MFQFRKSNEEEESVDIDRHIDTHIDKGYGIKKE